MKALIATVAAGLLAVSFAVPANAVPSKASRTAMAQHEASCKAEAAKKFSAVHFMKRRAMVNECMGRTAHAKPTTVHHVKAVKMQKKAQPTTTGQSVK
jgi:hypothetical protein